METTSLSTLSNQELIELANSLNSTSYDDDHLVRKLAAEFFGHASPTTFVGLGVPIAIELAARLEAATPVKTGRKTLYPVGVSDGTHDRCNLCIFDSECSDIIKRMCYKELKSNEYYDHTA